MQRSERDLSNVEARAKSTTEEKTEWGKEQSQVQKSALYKCFYMFKYVCVAATSIKYIESISAWHSEIGKNHFVVKYQWSDLVQVFLEASKKWLH